MIADILRALFYLALAASIGVYAWRLYRHVVHKETRHDREERRRLQREAEAGSSPPRSPSAGRPTGTDSGRPAPKSPSFVKQAFAPPSLPDEQLEDGSLVRDVIRQELAKKEGKAPPAPSPPASEPPAETGRTGLFAKPQLPVAELLAGVALPCDLAPLVDGDELDPHRVLFATSGYPPSTVASSLADELERLGFRIDTVGEHEAVARRAEGDLRIAIHDDVTAFPGAPRDGVVVELTT